MNDLNGLYWNPQGQLSSGRMNNSSVTDGFSPFTPDDVAALRLVRGYARHQPGCPAASLSTVDKITQYLELIVSGRYTVVEAALPKTREIL